MNQQHLGSTTESRRHAERIESLMRVVSERATADARALTANQFPQRGTTVRKAPDNKPSGTDLK